MTNNTTPSLTQRECDALYAALDRGYFDVPRQVPLTELTDDLDTTGVELSERFRAGTEALLQHQRGESRVPTEEP
jgi:predicted DNA binding protein